MVFKNKGPFAVAESRLIERLLSALQGAEHGPLVTLLRQQRTAPKAVHVPNEHAQNVCKFWAIAFEASNIYALLKKAGRTSQLDSTFNALGVDRVREWVEEFELVIIETNHPTSLWQVDDLLKLVRIATLTIELGHFGDDDEPETLLGELSQVFLELFVSPIALTVKPTTVDEANAKIQPFGNVVRASVAVLKQLATSLQFPSKNINDRAVVLLQLAKFLKFDDWNLDMDGRPVDQAAVLEIAKLKGTKACEAFLDMLWECEDILLEPISQKLVSTMGCLGAGQAHTQESYETAEALLAELLAVLPKLGTMEQEHLLALICAVKVFGFHLTSAQLRFASKDVAVALPVLGTPTAPENPQLQVMAAAFSLADIYGTRAISLGIVAGTSEVEDVLGLVTMVAHNGFMVPCVPLLEDADPLRRGHIILRELLSKVEFQAMLAASGNRLIVQLGCSDANRGGGIGESWTIRKCLYALRKLARDFGLRLVVHLGVGETCPRFARPPGIAIPTLPLNAQIAGLQWTLQGHTATLYNCDEGLMRAYLEEMIVGAARACLRDEVDIPEEWESVLDRFADTNLQSYAALMASPAMLALLDEAAIPLDVLLIASRPNARKKTLRAIGLNAKLYQIRLLLTAWFGVGKSLLKACGGDMSVLQEMYREDKTTFFRGLIDSVRRAMLMVQLEVATLYASELSAERDAAIELMRLIGEDFAITQQVLEEITGAPLATGYKNFVDRVEARNVVLQTLHAMQVEALRIFHLDETNETARLNVGWTIRAISAALAAFG